MVESRLFAGEKLLWTGTPWRGLFLFRGMDVFMVPFSLFWAGGVATFSITAWRSGADIISQLFSLPFLFVGFYATLGRFLVDAWLRTSTGYAVTTQRVLIERRGLFPSLKSLDIERLPALELHERADGSGTIRFGGGSLFQGNGMGAWSPALDPTPQFLRIEHVRQVYETIARQGKRAGSIPA